MGNLKKTFDFGGVTLTVEVKNAPSVEPRRHTTCGWGQPQCAPQPKGGEGIMVAVQKPQREFYDWGWRGEETFRDHSRKYANLEKAAKACDWPNDLIDNGAIKWPVPQTQPVARRAPQPKPWEVCACRPSQPTREVRQKCGLVPIGARVVDHTWNGEPIFDR